MVRTTLNLDDDVLAIAKAAADAEGVSLGTIVSRLARQGLAGGKPVADDDDLPSFSVPPGTPPLTLEQLRAAMDDA